jgi:hypothetical protein
MRFHFGAVPDDPHFYPEAEGWSPIREPGPWMIQFIAMPVSFVLIVLSGGLLYLVFPRELLFSQPLPASLLCAPTWFWMFILLIPIHEFLHAVCHPGWGFSSNSVIGVWPSKVLVYAHYEGMMSRNRFLLTLAMPYIVLGLVPIPIVAVSEVFGLTSLTAVALTYLSLIGSVLACGDAVGFWVVSLQIPSSAIVRNKGWKTYWKPSVPENPSLTLNDTP